MARCPSACALGLAPADITDVVLTHLHFDHIGWASVDRTPYFPNASYWIAQDDLDHFRARKPGSASSATSAPGRRDH